MDKVGGEQGTPRAKAWRDEPARRVQGIVSVAWMKDRICAEAAGDVAERSGGRE